MEKRFSISYLYNEIENFNINPPLNINKSELEIEKNVYASVEELTKNLTSGSFSVEIDNVNFECFYHVNETNVVSPTRHLYVFYSSARTANDPSPKSPHFSRWSYYPILDSMNSALLCIDDPMIQKCEAEDFVLGWFYGTREKSYIQLSLEIVKAVLNNLNLTNNDVIFFGSSSGGYVGIYAASMLTGSLAIAINPQIYIQHWTYTQEFEKITGIDLQEKDELHRNDLVNLIKGNPSKYVILFNAMSSMDFKSQLEPFCNDMAIIPHYGLTKKDNVLLWIYYAKGTNSPHNAFETRNIFLGIDSIAKRFHEDENPEKMQCLALFINRYWEEYYTLRFKLYKFETPEGYNYASHVETFIMYLMSLARIDVKLKGSNVDLKVKPSDRGALVSKPDWFQKNGVGYVITSYKKNIKLRLETDGEAELQIHLKGIYVLNPKQKGAIPYWVDYTSLKIDKTELLSETCTSWHNKPYTLSKKVQGKNVFNVEISWQPHM